MRVHDGDCEEGGEVATLFGDASDPSVRVHDGDCEERGDVATSFVDASDPSVRVHDGDCFVASLLAMTLTRNDINSR